MIDRPTGCGQLDLLVRAANALEPSQMPPPIRMEVTLLLTRLMHWEFPRLCRGGSRSLTFSGVHPGYPRAVQRS